MKKITMKPMMNEMAGKKKKAKKKAKNVMFKSGKKSMM